MDAGTRLRVGDALLLIHQCISRGLHMAGLYCRIFSQTGFPDGKLRPGFADYVRSLVSVLHAHHLAEDELAFPVFRELLPEAPWGELADEHLRIASMVDEVRLKVEQAADEPESGEVLRRVDVLLARLAEIWRPHIAVEEVHFSSARINAVMGPDEQATLLGQIGEANQRQAEPDYLVVPFTLFNLAPEDRAAMSGMMPTVVTQHLVPVVWKEKWLPMSPFLLV